MEVSQNGGPPKWMLHIIKKHCFWHLQIQLSFLVKDGLTRRAGNPFVWENDGSHD